MPHEFRGEIAPIRWWQVVLGGLAFAVVGFVLIWGFAILGFLMEGAGA